MSEFRTLLAEMRRPSLLIRAARLGLCEYRRDRDLRRLVAQHATPEKAIKLLLSEEDRLETRRRKGDAGYSLALHIEVLIALLAEVSLFTPGN
jgi:hypothetical protein